MNINTKALKGVVDEIEASRARQKAETEFQREALKSAVKNHQLDAKAVRIVLQRRAMGEQKRDEQDYYVHAYELALGGKKAALEALEQGATVREAAKAGGISTGAAGNLAKVVQKSSFVDAPHNPETGEVIDGAQPSAAETGRDTDSGNGEDNPAATTARVGDDSEGGADETPSVPIRDTAGCVPAVRLRLQEGALGADASDCEARDIQESCGSRESGPVGGNPGVVTTGAPTSGRPSDDSTQRVDGGETPAGVATRPHDTDQELAAGEGGIRTHDAPESTAGDQPTAINHSATSEDAPVASFFPPEDSTRTGTVGEARGEARTNSDGLDIPEFLRRPRERVMESALPRLEEPVP